MSDIAPHRCPECDREAYVGLNQVECINPGCRHHHADTRLKHREEVGGQEGFSEQEWSLIVAQYVARYRRNRPTAHNTPPTKVVGFPIAQPAYHWRSTLTLTPFPCPPGSKVFECDPLWIHQCSLGDRFNHLSVDYRVVSIDRFANTLRGEEVFLIKNQVRLTPAP